MRLEEVVGQEEIVERLKSYVSAKNIPHLLFSGPPGVGKTASAIAMTRQLFDENWGLNFKELNASDERGIEVVRDNIKNFARTAPIGNTDFKIIFLDEADALTPAAQSALRRTMERFSSSCRFILSCNYSSKVIEPIQSRCVVYHFHRLSEDALSARIRYIAENEGIVISDEGIKAIVYVSSGDMRGAINALQSAAALDRKIDAEMVYLVTSTADPKKIVELIESTLDGDLGRSMKMLRGLFDMGLSGEEIVVQIYRSVFDIDIPDDIKLKLIGKIGDTEFRIIEGANEELQLEALISQFVLTSNH
jgi:replication factor C small subunit